LKIGVSPATFCSGLLYLIRQFVHQFIRMSDRTSDLDLSSVTFPTWWSRLAVRTNRYQDASIDCTPPRPAAGVSPLVGFVVFSKKGVSIMHMLLAFERGILER
jgi:hypothetical protein